MVFFLLAHAAFAAAPIAEAGTGLLAYVDDTVILDGSGSFDDDQDALTFAWSQAGGPSAKLDDDAISAPRFTIDEPGTYRFRLVVNDGAEDSLPDQTEVVVPYKALEPTSGCSVGAHQSWVAVILAALAMGKRRL